MLRIWGRNNSVNVQKALWCCEEMSLTYERVDAGTLIDFVEVRQGASVVQDPAIAARRLQPDRVRGILPTRRRLSGPPNCS